MLSKHQSFPSPAPISTKIDNSVNQITKRLEKSSTKFDSMANTSSNIPSKDTNVISSAMSSVINEEKEI